MARPPAYVFTNRVYPPVPGATGEFLRELCEGLAAEGSRVTVVTSRGPASLGLPPEEIVCGVRLVRVGSAPFTRSSHARRALSYLGLYPQFASRVRALGAVDAAVSMTDPPLQVAAVARGRVPGRRRIHWAQDLYPELAEQLGVLRPHGLAAAMLRRVSTSALRRQDAVVAVGRCMRERLVGRGVDRAKIRVIPNWSSVRAPTGDAVRAARQRLGSRDDFVVLYSGNMGLAHDFDTVTDAVRRLHGTRVRFVFAGEGARAEELRRTLSAEDSVRFIASEPREALSGFLGAADIHIVSVRQDLGGLVVPSKYYGILGAGRPLAYVGPDGSEVALSLAETGAGIAVRNGDGEGLAEALRALASDPARVEAMAARAVAQDCSFGAALAAWKEVLGGALSRVAEAASHGA